MENCSWGRRYWSGPKYTFLNCKIAWFRAAYEGKILDFSFLLGIRTKTLLSVTCAHSEMIATSVFHLTYSHPLASLPAFSSVLIFWLIVTFFGHPSPLAIFWWTCHFFELSVSLWPIHLMFGLCWVLFLLSSKLVFHLIVFFTSKF